MSAATDILSPETVTGAHGSSLQQLVRPLPKDGAADCPQCHSLQSVARHNADWTCYKCGYCEIVDDDRAGRFVSTSEKDFSNIACADTAMTYYGGVSNEADITPQTP